MKEDDFKVVKEKIRLYDILVKSIDTRKSIIRELSSNKTSAVYIKSNLFQNLYQISDTIVKNIIGDLELEIDILIDKQRLL